MENTSPDRCLCCNQPIENPSRSIHIDSVDKPICFICIETMESIRARWNASHSLFRDRARATLVHTKDGSST